MHYYCETNYKIFGTNGRGLANDLFQIHFHDIDVCISLQTAMKFGTTVTNVDRSTLLREMVWRTKDIKSLPKPMTSQVTDAHVFIKSVNDTETFFTLLIFERVNEGPVMWSPDVSLALARTSCWTKSRVDDYLRCYSVQMKSLHMMMSSNGNIFRVTGPLGGLRWIPRTKASDAELWCFLWFAPN